jgi:hypothetical protein
LFETIWEQMMNERIRLLAEQAGLLPKEIGPVVETRHMKKKEQDLEKFAELIVRECANHCDLLLDHKISSEWSRGTHDCSRAIKQHFGVEE